MVTPEQTAFLAELTTARVHLDRAIAVIEDQQSVKPPSEANPTVPSSSQAALLRGRLGAGLSAAVAEGCGGTGILAVLRALPDDSTPRQRT